MRKKRERKGIGHKYELLHPLPITAAVMTSHCLTSSIASNCELWPHAHLLPRRYIDRDKINVLLRWRDTAGESNGRGNKQATRQSVLFFRLAVRCSWQTTQREPAMTIPKVTKKKSDAGGESPVLKSIINHYQISLWPFRAPTGTPQSHRKRCNKTDTHSTHAITAKMNKKTIERPVTATSDNIEMRQRKK